MGAVKYDGGWHAAIAGGSPPPSWKTEELNVEINHYVLSVFCLFVFCSPFSSEVRTPAFVLSAREGRFEGGLVSELGWRSGEMLPRLEVLYSSLWN